MVKGVSSGSQPASQQLCALGQLFNLLGPQLFPLWNGDNNRIHLRAFALAVSSAWGVLPLHICISASLLTSNVSKSEGLSLTMCLKHHRLEHATLLTSLWFSS